MEKSFEAGKEYQTTREVAVKIDRGAYIIPAGKKLIFVKVSYKKIGDTLRIPFFWFRTDAGNMVKFTDLAAGAIE